MMFVITIIATKIHPKVFAFLLSSSRMVGEGEGTGQCLRVTKFLQIVFFSKEEVPFRHIRDKIVYSARGRKFWWLVTNQKLKAVKNLEGLLSEGLFLEGLFFAGYIFCS